MKIKPGDVFELSTDRGLAYGQVTHTHAIYGELIRVLPGFCEQRPTEFSEIVERRTRFRTFVALQAAVAKRVGIVVTNRPIPQEDQKFPIFRAGVVNEATGRVEVWIRC